MATSDADKKYKDQGLSFGESFAPIVDPIVALLKSAYGAWMDADQVYNDADDAVLGKLEEAALLIADAGFTAADFLGEVIDNAIMDFGMSDSDKELTNKVLGWVKGGGGKVLSPLIDAGHEVVDFIKPYGGTLDSALINEIDRPLKKWIAGEIEEIGAIFGAVVKEAKIDEETGRFGWEKSLTDAIQNFGKNFVARIKEMDTNPDLQEGAGVFANELDARITNLQLLIRTASGDELEDVPAWEAELDLLTERLTTMPEDDDPEALAEWMAGTPDTPEGLRVTDTFSVRGDDKQILEDAIAVVEAKVPRFDSAADKKYRDEASVLAASKRRGTGKIINPGDTAIDGSAPVPDDSFADNYPEFRKNQADETLATLQERTLAADLARTNRAPETTIDPNYGKDPDKDGLGDTGGGDNGGKGSELTDEAMKYINENFGSVEFFQNFHGDKMWIDTDGDGTLDTNVIQKIIDDKEENPDVIWGLFQKTQWFQENGPTARQFQVDWSKAGGTNDWSPSFNADAGIGMQWNMNAGMHEMLDDTYDSLILEANRLGINTDDPVKKNAIMQMAYNAKQLNMTDFEIKSEFANGFQGAFDINKVQGSGTFLNIKQQLRQNAATYMMKLDEATLNDYTQKIYLGKATYEGITAGHAQSVMDQEPALKSLIEQGYTPSAYFSSYSNTASELLGRPIDFLGGDSKLYHHLKDTMVANDGLNRPMTRGEFQRYVRSTPEWDTSENARDEAYGTVGTLLNSFGIKV